MNRLCFFVAGILALVVTGGNAAHVFPIYDYGTERAYGTNISSIIEAVKTTGFYKFTKEEFVPGSYDIFNGPVVIFYRPEDQVYLRGYYFPRGLSEIFSYGSDKRKIFEKYAPIRRYFLKELAYKFPNAFTPKAAEIGAPELYFYDVKEFISGEKLVEDYIPVIYFAPQHERPAGYYKEEGFLKIAEFGIISPYLSPLYSNFGISQSEGIPPPFSGLTAPMVYYTYSMDSTPTVS